MTRKAAFARRLRDAMYNARVNQKDLGERTGIDRSNISNYLAGKYYPKYGTIMALAVALGVDPTWLEGRDLWDEDEKPDLEPVLFELTDLEKSVVKIMRLADYGTQARILASAADLLQASGVDFSLNKNPGGADFVIPSTGQKVVVKK